MKKFSTHCMGCMGTLIKIIKLFSSESCKLYGLRRVSFSSCTGVFVIVVWQPGPHDRSGHSGQWHSSRALDASRAGGVKNAGRPHPLSRRWMERSVHSPIDEWSDPSCQRRSTGRLQYPAYTCVCVRACPCVCALTYMFADSRNKLQHTDIYTK